MSSTHRDPRPPLALLSGTNDCPSGKFAHLTRRSAKQHASKLRRRNGEHVRPYRCPACLLWHVGHLPAVVMRGEQSADQAYGRVPLDQPEDLGDRMGQLLTGLLAAPAAGADGPPYTHTHVPVDEEGPGE